MGTRYYHSRQIRDSVHIVCQGETIGSIGRKYGIKTKALIQANNLNRKAAIRIGQKLVLPGRKSVTKRNSIIILKKQAKRKP
jgi:LysM repeat protein